MRVLLFTLYAPMASFGEVAVGERRMGWASPGRSAVLGLVAAAMGIDRDDEEAHRGLEVGLHYAVRTDAPGVPFVDYHTAQAPKHRKGRSFATRRDELAAHHDLNTVLSRREWRSDACFTVALWARGTPGADVDGLAQALRHPHYVLYVGRKSAPLGLPLNPAVVEADSFLDALDARTPTAAEREVLVRARSTETLPVIACDLDAAGLPEEFRRERRRDGVRSRRRWQFDDRDEAVFAWTGGSE